MEFAEWVVSGLDQLRLGRLPAGNDFYATASAGLGDDPRLPAYMNSGDPSARAELVQVIAAAVAANPGFEERLRTAAAATQAQGQALTQTQTQTQTQLQVPFQGQAPFPASAGKPPFLKTTNGILVLAAAAVLVVGGGVGLALGLSGSSSGNLAAILKGTWSCQASGPGAADTGGTPLSFTVGDGTWNAGTASGTWKQDGSSATLHDANDPTNDVKANGLPTGAGAFDVTLGNVGDSSQLVSIHIKGTLAAHKLTVALPGDNGDLDLTCTK
ncbi:hypothetical protein ABH935_009029 [Catenulispora sp. GAS73]|uniref:hypothetical protein n=1 Tax=Catenulispora sp. GAS73 TaxID=3156269 RepID=UPI00351714EF